MVGALKFVRSLLPFIVAVDDFWPVLMCRKNHLEIYQSEKINKSCAKLEAEEKTCCVCRVLFLHFSSVCVRQHLSHGIGRAANDGKT